MLNFTTLLNGRLGITIELFHCYSILSPGVRSLNAVASVIFLLFSRFIFYGIQKMRARKGGRERERKKKRDSEKISVTVGRSHELQERARERG